MDVDICMLRWEALTVLPYINVMYGIDREKEINVLRNCQILHCIYVMLWSIFNFFLIETGTKWDFLEGHPSYRGVDADRGHLEHFVRGSRGGHFYDVKYSYSKLLQE